MRADFVGEFNQHLLRALLPEPYYLGQVIEVARPYCALKRLARRSAQNRKRSLRSDSRDRKDEFKEIAVGRGRKPIEFQTVLLQRQMRRESRFVSDNKRLWRAHAHLNTEALHFYNSAYEPNM